MSKSTTGSVECPDWRCSNDDLDSAGDLWPDHDYFCVYCHVCYTAEEVMLDE